MLTRRRVLQFGAATAAAMGLHTWRIEPHWLEIVHRRLPIRHLPGRLSGKTLVQLSDVHVGPRVDNNYVLSTFSRVTALQPDIVVMTGDFCTYHPAVFDQVSSTAGEFALSGERHLYINRGVGHLLRVRFNV